MVEVGLSFVQGENFSGELEFNRVDVSGYSYDELPPGCFEDGNLCLDALEAVNPGIGRPNIAFRIVGENVCAAAEVVEVTTAIDCKTAGNVGDNTEVERYIYSDLTGFCDAVQTSGVVHSDGIVVKASLERQDQQWLCVMPWVVNAVIHVIAMRFHRFVCHPLILPLVEVAPDISRDDFAFVKCPIRYAL